MRPRSQLEETKAASEHHGLVMLAMAAVSKHFGQSPRCGICTTRLCVVDGYVAGLAMAAVLLPIGAAFVVAPGLMRRAFDACILCTWLD